MLIETRKDLKESVDFKSSKLARYKVYYICIHTINKQNQVFFNVFYMTTWYFNSILKLSRSFLITEDNHQLISKALPSHALVGINRFICNSSIPTHDHKICISRLD